MPLALFWVKVTSNLLYSWDCLEFLTLLPPPFRGWDDKHIPLNLLSSVMAGRSLTIFSTCISLVSISELLTLSSTSLILSSELFTFSFWSQTQRSASWALGLKAHTNMPHSTVLVLSSLFPTYCFPYLLYDILCWHQYVHQVGYVPYFYQACLVLLIISYIYFCVDVYAHRNKDTGLVLETGSFLLSCESQGLNSDCGAWWQVPLLSKPFANEVHISELLLVEFLIDILKFVVHLCRYMSMTVSSVLGIAWTFSSCLFLVSLVLWPRTVPGASREA